ncbi:hypothetical protein [Chelativorans salis]|uniref:Uncharacterized protein n=1 Tax=Chelativorans salis TaxID=2978478 RepID=A0ABT2LQK0_9HYPH|nr:hypothetical protein [Chelativorans sp. EGI FJ00035]MCT7375469.1 hypothetical protein [Chelativorans sp. EGI FJ00035]
MGRDGGDKNALEDVDETRIVEWARAIYGADAPTAVAYCALEARAEGNQEEYGFWFGIFNRLRN